jgi:cell division control protein 7
MEDEINDIEQEIEQFNHYFKQIPFKIIDKIGQGTFSSVYKAVDLKHRKYDNSKWCNCTQNTQCGYVALKRIYATSSPNRIFTELALLHCLGDHPNIAPLITAIRHEDQVVAVLPYFSHDQFKVLLTNKNYYKKMDSNQVKCYLHALLSALKHVHAKGYIHRLFLLIKGYQTFQFFIQNRRTNWTVD